MRSMGIEVGEHGELHTVPAIAWAGSFVVCGLGGGTTLVLLLLSPWWLGWNWNGALPLQVLGGVLLIGSVVAGTWAVAKMGWARLLFAGALFPSGAGAEENGVPQRLVVEGPYRYVRTLYMTRTSACSWVQGCSLAAGLSCCLLSSTWASSLQLPLEERELSGSASASH